MEPCQRRRAGCTECKRKKAKCDEKKPSCSRCYKYPHLCSYELSVKTFRVAKPKSPKTNLALPQPTTPYSPAVVQYSELPESPPIVFEGELGPFVEPSTPVAYFHLPPANEPPDHSELSSTQTLSLSVFPPFIPTIHCDPRRLYFQHFVTHTAGVYFPLQPDVALGLILPAADNSSCMLGAMIAASSSQLFRTARNPDSKNTAIMATVECLEGLREAITAPIFGNQGVTILPTTLMLATTCVCAGDTATFRKHLNGALNIVQRDKSRYSLDPLWWLSLKWLVHLLLMNRLSGLPLPTRQRRGFIDWNFLLTCMPDLGRIDVTSGFSRELVAALDMVCQLSEPSCIDTEAADLSRDENLSRMASIRHLEDQLIELRSKKAPIVQDLVLRTELESSHRLFTDATLLCLYRRVDELPKNHIKVQMTVTSIIESLENIDKGSRVHAQLPWPLLSAGCESTSSSQRTIILERMQAMATRGLGTYENVLEFMKNYWMNGGDMRWDVFAKQTGKDLVLF